MPLNANERTLRGLRAGLQRRDRLEMSGHDVGRALIRGAVEALRDVSMALEGLVQEAEDVYVQGYLQAVSDVTAAALLDVEAREADESRQRLLERRLHRAAVEELKAGPRVSGGIAAALNRSAPQVSRVLMELRAAGLVEMVKDTKDARRREYFLTALGQRLSRRSSTPSSEVFKQGVDAAVHAIEVLRRDGVCHESTLAAAVKGSATDPIAAVQYVLARTEEASISHQAEAAVRYRPRLPHPVEALAAERASFEDVLGPILALLRAERLEEVCVRARPRFFDVWRHAGELARQKGHGRFHVFRDAEAESGLVVPPRAPFLYVDDPGPGGERPSGLPAFAETAEVALWVEAGAENRLSVHSLN